jgi:heme exporter protein A
MSHYLEIDKLACIRGDRLLFQALSLQASEGELVRVEGINGSGKTSLLRILCGLSRPSEGVVRWSGKDVQRNRAAYRDCLAYLGHSNGIKQDLTPYENLRVARSLANAPSNVDISDALAQLDLEGYEHLPSRQLSMGQQRRVALARLLVSDKTLWILDEPFTSLDSNGITLVENLLNAHAARGGISVLTTHHQLHGVKCRIIPLNLSWQA